jgi:hypothetical protein
MHNGLGSTHKTWCVNLPTITSHHRWLLVTLETMCFCCQKSKASATCGQHMVFAKKVSNFGLCGLNKLIWFSTMKDEILLKSTKLFGLSYLNMVR